MLLEEHDDRQVATGNLQVHLNSVRLHWYQEYPGSDHCGLEWVSSNTGMIIAKEVPERVGLIVCDCCSLCYLMV